MSRKSPSTSRRARPKVANDPFAGLALCGNAVALGNRLTSAVDRPSSPPAAAAVSSRPHTTQQPPARNVAQNLNFSRPLTENGPSKSLRETRSLFASSARTNRSTASAVPSSRTADRTRLFPSVDSSPSASLSASLASRAEFEALEQALASGNSLNREDATTPQGPLSEGGRRSGQRATPLALLEQVTTSPQSFVSVTTPPASTVGMSIGSLGSWLSDGVDGGDAKSRPSTSSSMRGSRGGGKRVTYADEVRVSYSSDVAAAPRLPWWSATEDEEEKGDEKEGEEWSDGKMRVEEFEDGPVRVQSVSPVPDTLTDDPEFVYNSVRHLMESAVEAASDGEEEEEEEEEEKEEEEKEEEEGGEEEEKQESASDVEVESSALASPTPSTATAAVATAPASSLSSTNVAASAPFASAQAAVRQGRQLAAQVAQAERGVMATLAARSRTRTAHNELAVVWTEVRALRDKLDRERERDAAQLGRDLEDLRNEVRSLREMLEGGQENERVLERTMTGIERGLLTLKGRNKSECDAEAREEEKLEREVALTERRIELWEREKEKRRADDGKRRSQLVVGTGATVTTTHQAKSVMGTTRDLLPEVLAVEEFLTQGRRWGGWDEADHLYFARHFERFPEPSQRARLLERVRMRLATRSDTDIEEHCDWFVELRRLEEAKRYAIRQWKTERAAEKATQAAAREAEVARREHDASAQSGKERLRRGALDAVEAEAERRRKRREVEEWKRERERVVAREAAAEQARQARHAQDQEAARRRRREEAKAMLEEQQAMRQAQAAVERVDAREKARAEAERRRVAAQEIAQRRERDRLAEKARARDKEARQRAKAERQQRQEEQRRASVRVERSQARAMQVTAAVRARQEGRDEHEQSTRTVQRNYTAQRSVRDIPRTATPAWMK